MDASSLISHYEQLSLLTAQMRAAAEQGEWDQLVELELRRNGVLAAVKPMDETVVLRPEELQRKSDYIKVVLSHDIAIRSLVQAHLGQIQLDIASGQNTQRLRQAYGV